MKKQVGLLFLILALPYCLSAKSLKPGSWHIQFELREGVFLPVDCHYTKNRPHELIISNGEEDIHLTRLNRRGDSLFIPFITFDAELKIKIHSNKHLTGAWFNRAKSSTYHVPFIADYNGGPRYPTTNRVSSMAGKWEVTFDYQNQPEKAIGLFSSENNLLFTGCEPNNIMYGTFLTETGDYRYLEGATYGDSLYLSCFDGSHAFLFRALLKNDTLWGDFHSGSHYKTDWFAVRNPGFELTDPDSLTYIVNKKPITFELPSIDGSMVRYPGPAFENKVVLIQILGTWCPNCMDESNYLQQLYSQYTGQLEILAVTFETQNTTEEKIEKVKKYKDALGLDYTLLIGGNACKECASRLFPQLSEITSFPTLIFIDKTGHVRKIHTGFSGPGTGEYYSEFVEETDSFIELLINE